MDNDQAYKILEQALNIAATKGCFGLQDSASVFTALKQIEQLSKYEFVNYGTGLISTDIYDKISNNEQAKLVDQKINKTSK